MIQAYADAASSAMLKVRDPLSERVHLSQAGTAGYGLGGTGAGELAAAHRPRPSFSKPTPGA